ncbi:MAG: glycosyltransferase family 4 protein [Acidobacteria bacterium]|nr:glycosyltransferase family 4 protein [Acidobacteriota bacterium]
MGEPGRLRVALVVYGLPGGGMEKMLLTLGAFLRANGMVVDVVTTEYRGAWFGRVAEAGLRPVHVEGAERAWRAVLPHYLTVGRRLARGGYDAVLLNYARFAQASLGMLPDRTLRVSILHNDHPRVIGVGCANRSALDAVVAVGPRLADRAVSLAGGRPVLTIPNGVDIPPADALARRRPWGTPLRLACVGRVDHRQKGVLLLPDILGALDRVGIDFRLAVAGDGPDAPELASTLKSGPFADRVDLMGAVPPEAVYPILLDTHFLLMPSSFEGLPLTLMEAMACGCVPVVSRLTGITDTLVSEGANGWFAAAGDPAGFADAVRRGAEPGRWSAMSRDAAETARRRYSSEAMCASYLALIRGGPAGVRPCPRSRRRRFPLHLPTVLRYALVPPYTALRSRLGLMGSRKVGRRTEKGL